MHLTLDFEKSDDLKCIVGIYTILTNDEIKLDYTDAADNFHFSLDQLYMRLLGEGIREDSNAWKGLRKRLRDLDDLIGERLDE